MSNDDLNPHARKILGIVVGSLIGISPVLSGLATSNAVSIPSWVYLILGISSFIAYQVKTAYDIKTTEIASRSSTPTT